MARSGWGRFAAGILIGLALGIGAVFYGNSTWLNRPATADKVIAAASPESRDPSTGARVSLEAPEIVDSSANAQPVGEEAPRPAAAAAQPATPLDVIETSEPAIEPTPEPAALTLAPTPAAADAASVVENAGGTPAWQRNAVAFSVPSGRPIIAIVLDDVGVVKSHAEQAIALPAEVTLAFMTYAAHVDDMAKRARARGHELLVHVPMEPLSIEMDPGPRALRVGNSAPEILERLHWGLDRTSAACAWSCKS
jgi:hypothetical protein